MQLIALGAATSPHVTGRADVFRRFGHKVTLISPVAGAFGSLEIVAPKRRSGRSGKFLHVFDVLRLVARARGDLYHAHYASELTTWAAWILRKRPLVISVMGGDVLFDEQGTAGPIGRWLTRRALRGADLVTAKSQLLAQRVKDFGVDGNRIRLVVWGVDRSVFRPTPEQRAAVRASWGVSDDTMLVYSPRMLQPLYNQHVMVEALKHVPNVHLAISTFREDRSYREHVLSKAYACGVSSRIVFVPPSPQREMARAYGAADVVLSLAASDGFPQSVLEAMACKVPVIVSNLACYRERLADGSSALFVPIEPEPVAAMLNRLVASPELREQLSHEGYQVIIKDCDFHRNAVAVETEMRRLTERD